MNNRCARAIGGPEVENHHAFSIQLAICHALQPSELTVCSPDLIIQSVVSNFLDTIGHLLQVCLCSQLEGYLCIDQSHVTHALIQVEQLGVDNCFMYPK